LLAKGQPYCWKPTANDRMLSIMGGASELFGHVVVLVAIIAVYFLYGIPF
jgi:hypothetical protein